MSSALRAADIHARIGPAWPAILNHLGISDEFLRGKKKPGPCPACGGVDRFFIDNRTGCGDFHCRNCKAGDGCDLLMRVHRWTFSEARRRVLEAAGLAEVESERARKRQEATQLHGRDADGNPVRSPPIGGDREAGSTAEIISKKLGVGENTVQDWSERAEAIWRRTLPLRGSIGQVYLEHRGCVLPPKDSHLRFLPASGKYPPSLCAAVTDAKSGKPISLHFTRLAADGNGRAGTEQDKLLLAGHRKKGGIVRLWPDESAAYGIALAEGIESALAAAHACTPVWSTVDAGNMAAFPVLSGIEALTIFSDHDPAGRNAARTAAQRWADAGREVDIVMATEDGADVADLVAA